MKLLCGLLLSIFCTVCVADDSRPASLTLAALNGEDIAPTHFEVVWKVPYKGRQIPALSVEFDAATKAISPKRISDEYNTVVKRWQIERAIGLAGLEITINGLEGSSYQTLLRVVSGETGTLTAVLNTENTRYQIPALQQPVSDNIIIAYTVLGFEHILTGIDHLLFVFALVLLISNIRTLLLTITSFTAAHSITLIAVSLGWMQVPGPPVEASIALSIIFLARELIALERGGSSLAARFPWLVAFAFGLLHGMGFAGALSDIGVPEQEAIAALLSFNIGVELGQLLFVCVVLLALQLVKKIPIPAWSRLIPAYGVGSIASIWLLQRLMNF